MIPASSATELKEYVRQGGHLVAEARLGWSNEKGSSSPTIPGMGLHEVMGSRETDVQTGKAGRTILKWTGSDLPGFNAGETLQARWYEETLEPLGAQAHVVATFPNGNAAAVISEYGKGKTLMLGSYVGAAYETRRESIHRALLQCAARLGRRPVTHRNLRGGTGSPLSRKRTRRAGVRLQSRQAVYRTHRLSPAGRQAL